MSRDLTWLSKVGLDVGTGIAYTGNEDKYLSAVRRFYTNYEKNRDKVRKYYEAKDHENYRITVHALKSNARMIGAAKLAAEFELLEHAAGDGDIPVLEERTDRTLSSYGELIVSLKPVEELEAQRIVGELSAEEARKTAEKLLAALDEFDDDTSKELAEKLSGYPFRMTQREKLSRALEQIDDFMYDEAADLIREILPEIE